MHFSQQEIEQNHVRLLERNTTYRRFGYDAEKGTDYVLSNALPLRGGVFEIGTGKGRFLTTLLRYVPIVTTVDVDASEQRFARLNVAYEKPAGEPRFVVADAARLSCGEGVFDCIVSMNALHHMDNLPRILDELLRVVTPQGKIVLADLSEEGFAIFERAHLHEGWTHVHATCRFEELLEHLAA
jgi:ubiquinone/menaquinone biosynthesis C-methylase UbiE